MGTTDLKIKRQEVRTLYSKYGVGSIHYEKAFDELHDMNIDYMSEQYRLSRGRSQKSATPYDK